MSDVVSHYIVPTPVERYKTISWPAVFAGTFVALATELLFAAFGLFIGFTLSSPGGIDAWTKIWYFVTAFVSLLAGGWVAARASVAADLGGRMHAAITWGLTTIATFAFALWLSWTLLASSLATIRTVAVTHALTTAAALPQGEANRMRSDNPPAAQAPGAQATPPAAPQTAPQNLPPGFAFTGDASTLFLVVFGGILCGCVGALIGGTFSGRRILASEPAPVP